MADSGIDYAAKKRRIHNCLLVAAAIYGLALLLVPAENAGAEFVLGIPLLILLISWCFTDAEQRSFRIGRIHTVLLVFVFALAFPVYLFRTRGIGGFKSLGLSLLFALAIFGSMLASQYVGAKVLNGGGPVELEL